MLLESKVALVTGGGQGLGRVDALALADEGAHVAIIDIDIEKAEDTCHELTSKGVKSFALQADVGDFSQVQRATKKFIDLLGPIEILVNNAGIVDTASIFQDFSEEMWLRDLNVNLTGTFNCTKSVFPGMVEKKWGRIINISSIIGTMGGFGQASYATTKAGIIGFTKSLALEAGRYGITSNCIVPGIIKTEKFLKMPVELRKRMENRVALKKAGDPEDVAYTVVFLSSNKARYITGATLFVTGGIDLFVY
jgi:3-oxoacyl-[acyl-carrier protein] reductase